MACLFDLKNHFLEDCGEVGRSEVKEQAFVCFEDFCSICQLQIPKNYIAARTSRKAADRHRQADRLFNYNPRVKYRVSQAGQGHNKKLPLWNYN